MLRNETQANGLASNSIWSRPKRLATAFGLIALTATLATWKAPAQAEDDAPPSTRPTESKVEAPDTQAALPPLEPIYVPDTMSGVVAFRPATAFRHPGLSRLLPLVETKIAEDLDALAKTFQVDPSRSGFRKFDLKEVESVILPFNVGKFKPASYDPKGTGPIDPHTLEFSGMTVRMVAPFDWLAFLRQWKVGVEEVQDGRRVYYNLKLPVQAAMVGAISIYLPDDRTLVVDERQKWVQEVVRREVPSAPAYLQGADWRKASQGMLAIAINNQADKFTKGYDLGRPDDAVVLQCFQGVDRWVLGMADADAPSLRAEATTRDPQTAEAVARTIGGLVKLGQAAIDIDPQAQKDNPDNRVAKRLLANLKVEIAGQSVTLSTGEFGTYDEVIEAIEANDTQVAGDGAATPKTQAAEAKAKAEKR